MREQNARRRYLTVDECVDGGALAPQPDVGDFREHAYARQAPCGLGPTEDDQSMLDRDSAGALEQAERPERVLEGCVPGRCSRRRHECVAFRDEVNLAGTARFAA